MLYSCLWVVGWVVTRVICGQTVRDDVGLNRDQIGKYLWAFDENHQI